MIRSPYNDKGRLPLRIVIGCCLVIFTFAAPITAAATEDPAVVVREIFDDLLRQLDELRETDALTHDRVREVFGSLLNPRIDYLSLARWILRDYWVNSSADQQTEFLRAFERYIINTYALALANGDKMQLDVEDDPQLGKNTAVVGAAFKVEEAEAVPLDFRLLLRKERWLLFDVSFSGVSLARTFRSDFSYVAKEGGIDAVTEHLTRRTGSE